jgi:hypothetical protein
LQVRHWTKQQVEALLRHLATYAPCSGEALQQALGLQDSRSPEEVQQLAALLQRVLEVLAEVAQQAPPKGPKPGAKAADKAAAAAADAEGAEGGAAAAEAPAAAGGQPAAAEEGGAAAAGAAAAEKAGGKEKERERDPAELARLVSERVAVPEDCARALLGPTLLRALARHARAHLDAIAEHAAVAAKAGEGGRYEVPHVPTRGASLPKWYAAAAGGRSGAGTGGWRPGAAGGAACSRSAAAPAASPAVSQTPASLTPPALRARRPAGGPRSTTRRCWWAPPSTATTRWARGPTWRRCCRTPQ